MRIFGIDPGPEESAWVNLVIGEPTPELPWPEARVAVVGMMPNHFLAAKLYMDPLLTNHHLAIEIIEARPHGIDTPTARTQLWAGRFIQAYVLPHDLPYVELEPRRIRALLCPGVVGPKRKHVRQAIINHFPATGGGSVPQVGTKKQPGPLYCLRGGGDHKWAAAAVAVAAAELLREQGDG
jgi:hypothetical protein